MNAARVLVVDDNEMNVAIAQATLHLFVILFRSLTAYSDDQEIMGQNVAAALSYAGATLATHLFNGMGPLHHRAPGLSGAALTYKPLVPSLIPDGVHVHPAMVKLEAILAASGALDDPERPRQRSISAYDSGMGDMLRFDAERLLILVERHLLYTGSARARSILENWDEALKHFVKVMPNDYRRALLDLKGERRVAAE